MLTLLIILIGYFIFVGIVIKHMDNKRDISWIALSILLVYGCVVGIFFVIGKYLGQVGWLLYIVALLYSIFFIFWKCFCLFKMRPQIQMEALFIFVTYIFSILCITVFRRRAGEYARIQMEVFNWIGKEGVESPKHILLNVAMFMPIGAIYPLITTKVDGKIFSSVSFGISFSTLIETGQLVFQLGNCDVDDILSNSLGALIGAVIVVGGMCVKQKVSKKMTL